MVREEEMGRSETHEMATLQPHKNTVAGAALPAHTLQDVVSQADPAAREVTSTASSWSKHSGSDIDLPQRSVNDPSSNQPTRAGRGPSQAEAQTRVYFPTIVEKSMS